MLNLVLVGPTFVVLVNAAHPVRPGGKVELLLEEFPDATDAFTSVLLKAWNEPAVSGLGFSSAFFTSGSFNIGAAVAKAGAGFCGGFWVFWAIRFICLVHRAQYHTSRGSLTSLSVT